jgi:hypothetical protein
MDAKRSGSTLPEKCAQRRFSHFEPRKLNLAYLILGLKGDLRAFRSGIEDGFGVQFAAKYDNNLLDSDQVDQRVQDQMIRTNNHSGFLRRFPCGTLLKSFSTFEKSGRSRPFSEGGFMGTTAHQESVLPVNRAADEYSRIVIANFAARIAD